jgi:phosphoserine phosphatase RsbU/P
LYHITPCYIFSFSNEGKIIQMNQFFLTHLGYEASEVIMVKKLEDILTVGSRIFFQTHFYPLLKLHGKADEIFLSFLSKHGEELPVLLNVVLTGNNEQFRMHCGGMRISQRNKFEEKILEAKHLAEQALIENSELSEVRNQLEKNLEVLEKRLQKLSQNNLELRQINTVISHDLQEPLRKVSIFSSKLISGTQDSNKESLALLEKINGAADKMRTLLHNLQLYLSLSDKIVSKKKISLNELFNEAKRRAGVTPSMKFSTENLQEIPADPHLMVVLFYQLIHNSIKFRNPDSILHITLSAELIEQNIFREIENKYKYKEFIRIIYTDNGVGFNNAYASEVFLLFRKLHPETDGPGIGLSFCKKIAELHGGSISVRSAKNKGTVFTLLLPAS